MVKGSHHSKESKEKLRQANLGKKLTEEQKYKSGSATRGKKLPEEWKKSISIGNTGKKIGEETKEKMRQARKGKSPANKGVPQTEEARKKMSEAKTGKPMCQSTKEKLLVTNTGHVPSKETRRKISQAHLKNHHPDGLPPEPTEDRRNVDYRLWREEVYKRDNFTCQKTGKIGGKLDAHHILNFSSNPKLRYEVSNGITLDRKVHKNFHSIYGNKNNTKEQVDEFIKGNSINV